MKKLLFATMLLAMATMVPVPAMAQVGINVNISLPPPIVFASPPQLIVLPETYVYVVPGVEAEIFFYGGWWWRPWNGRWYRSRNYNSGWAYYKRVPSFYSGVPSGWRNDYRDHRWGGREWNYRPIPQRQVQQNWSSWEKNRHWEKQGTWGVQGLQPRTQAQPPRRVEQPRQTPPERIQQPRQQPQEKVQQQPQRQEQQPQGRQQRHEPQGQGRPEGGEGEHRR
jgi:hypothetical protein